MAEWISNAFNLPEFAMPSFGIGSILDIALIAFVVYKLLGWIRQTRAWGVFKGIGTLAMIYLIAYFLGMHTTIWIINQTVTWAVIALMIIFQPELRKVLDKLGKGRRLPFLAFMEEEKPDNSIVMMEQIVDAVVKMAKVKTGALIVIEQDVPIKELESSGVPLDAMISSQLLVNIFEKNTPLHDGAVLIRENRIKAATCILPLTSEHLDSSLGTRHRAAVGVSETVDACVLVVSEETGAVSIAKDGKLYRNLTADEVRKMLLSNIRPQQKTKRFKSRGKK
ncbi:MAG: diadenylate cyclase CdaA [Defluviitaleaceae bacterium]|nr:diadenylate cyclase CdaA [Defluviitaleaceae bacterium]